MLMAAAVGNSYNVLEQQLREFLAANQPIQIRWTFVIDTKLEILVPNKWKHSTSGSGMTQTHKMQ